MSQHSTPPLASSSAAESSIDPESRITPEMHLPPSPLPSQPTMLLVPWINHLGFKQIPRMFIGLFTEHESPVATARFVHVYVDRETRRPVPIPPEIERALQQLR